MSAPNIIHPIFTECQQYTLDEYWNDIFLACACNKFPRGMRYDEKSFTISVRPISQGGKSKIENIEVPQTSKELYLCMMDLFKEKLGLYSPRDIRIKKEELEDIQNRHRINLDCEWKKLKPKSTKDTMITNYVAFLKIKYNLSPKEARELLNTVNIGFQFKKLDSDHVDYEKGEIKNIEGLVFDADARKFSLTNKPKKTSKTEKAKNTQKFSQALDRYFRDYHNHKKFRVT